jgi:seryl-tRNA synthetase
MLDIAHLEGVLRRGPKVADLVDAWKKVDGERKALQSKLDALRARKNELTPKKGGEITAEFRENMKAMSAEIKAGETRLGELESEARAAQLLLPNVPHTSVPDGADETADETANPVVSTWGEKPTFDFQPKEHDVLGVSLGIMDFERAVKVSGARFTYLKGKGARLERALMAFMLDLHTSRGYTEMWAPVLVKREAMVGTGQLPKFEDDAFKTAPKNEGDHEFFLAPTAEVPVTNYHRDEILDGTSLPLKYTAYTACFRAEAGTYGKDTRGMIRQHQFDKVEIVKFVEPSTSYDELEGLRDDAEEVLRRLELHYRVSLLCTGDLGNASAKTYDLEVWLPGQNAYREISSCSNFEDWQARRAAIRYRPAQGEKPRPVHTLNGSGLAIGRTLVAILEQCQEADGSIRIPAALQPYTGFDRIPFTK